MQDRKRKIYRVNFWRRVAIPLLITTIALAGLVKWRVSQDPGLLRACFLFFTAAFFMFVYMHLIRLVVTPMGITLLWTLQEKKSLNWDDIVQVRRAEAPPGRNFFIDLICDPDRTIQFNPFFFDRPDDIIADLNEYLDSDIFEEDSLDSTQEIALTPETEGPTTSNRLLAAVLLLILIVAILYYYTNQ